MVRAFRALWIVFGVAVLLLACSAHLAQKRLDREFGEAQPKEREIATVPTQGVDYWSDVKPIIDARCVSCHGCYDSPCQLKLTEVEGLERGASKALIYDPSRVTLAPPTRLFEDAQTVEQWRQKEFFPVLNEREDTAQANREGSVLYQMLALKKVHPLPQDKRLSGFDFSLDRKQTCPTIEEFAEYQKEHPLGGMPFGLPGLSQQETRTVETWLEQGAVYAERPPVSSDLGPQLEQWERLLNRSDLKSRLIARYLYEHLFLAHLYFEDEFDRARRPGERTYFELVRSATPPSQAVERIATRRPHDDPGVPMVYYRLVPLRSTLIDKTHMPYSLSAERLKKWQTWFYDAPFEVDHLPSYDAQAASNPFQTFLQIPVGSRYRFLLDEARYTMDGFIKGPVCRGQVSLNVINDRFWVYFLSPDNVDQAEAQFYASQIPSLTLPPNEQTGTLVLARWSEYSKKEKAYLKAKAAFIKKQYGRAKPIDLDLIWTGDDARVGQVNNRNATLTVLRHEDSASVVQGLVGAPPKTAWVVGYGLLERIHYLLVADFDVYGNLSHQLITRVYMDFLRMEAEANFIALLPQADRSATVARWYVGAEEEAFAYIQGRQSDGVPETSVRYQSRNPQLELYEQLAARLAPAINRDWNVTAEEDGNPPSWFHALEELSGGPVTLLPQVSVLRVEHEHGGEYFTLLRDNDHTNILSIFDEGSRRRPELDRVTVVRGVLGAYPNALFRLKAGDLPEFSAQLGRLKNAGDYDAWRDRFGVRRTDPGFWAFSDLLYKELKQRPGGDMGRLDFNRLENR